ncbi:MAG: C40 family peptidase [Alphaproteobacteria bacterium]|nr:C40 family peptidase [Alphaproteobacteria bacterium]
MMRIITPSSPLMTTPDATSGRETDALFGEAVVIHQTVPTGQDDWAEITLTTDDYRAWIKASDLAEAPDPTHHVVVPRSLVTATPSIKSPHLFHLPLGALVTAEDAEGDVIAIHGANGVIGYMPSCHVLPIGTYVDEYVAIAEALISTPYLWGGRDSLGFDCSALVQLSLAAAGQPVPRNTGDQEPAIGTTLTDRDQLQRGDLVFWKGHVGIMTDGETLLHANAFHHMVAAEKLSDALPRLHDAAGPITRLARP